MKNRNETGFLDSFISGSITPSLKLMASQETPSPYWYHAWQAIACVAIVDHCFQLNTNNLSDQVSDAWQCELERMAPYMFNAEAAGTRRRVPLSLSIPRRRENPTLEYTHREGYTTSGY